MSKHTHIYIYLLYTPKASHMHWKIAECSESTGLGTVGMLMGSQLINYLEQFYIHIYIYIYLHISYYITSNHIMSYHIIAYNVIFPCVLFLFVKKNLWIS